MRKTEKEPTRIGTAIHPHVFFRSDEPAKISQRIHLVERENWKGRLKHPAHINYARTKRGFVVQFEGVRKNHTYCCHFPLKQLRKADFESNCPLVLVEFARELGVSANDLMVEALVHAQGME